MGRPVGPAIEAGIGIVKKKNKPRPAPGSFVALDPNMMARDGSEHGHQVALMLWSSEQERIAGYEPLRWLHAIPNGGDRDKVTAGRMKAEGVKSGVCDLFLPHARGGYFGIYIEMKKPEQILTNGKKSPAGTLSDNQKGFITFVAKEGYAAVTCWTWVQARDVLMTYFSWPVTQQQEKMRP
jgi:hypothetical protein